MAYKSSDADGAGPATAFDNILSGKWPSDKVFEDDTALAFRDINPQAPGRCGLDCEPLSYAIHTSSDVETRNFPVHILVIPKTRDGLTAIARARADQEALLGHLVYVAQSVGKKECPEGEVVTNPLLSLVTPRHSYIRKVSVSLLTTASMAHRAFITCTFTFWAAASLTGLQAESQK